MPAAITRELLNLSNTCTDISVCKRKGWSWRRFDWVTETIKFSAKQLKRGVPIDKIIDWKDKRKTAGNNFDSVQTFFRAMHIAATEYGMEDVPYRNFEHLRFSEIRNILTEQADGVPDHTIQSKYRLYDSQVLQDLGTKTENLRGRLVNTLEAVARSKGGLASLPTPHRVSAPGIHRQV